MTRSEPPFFSAALFPGFRHVMFVTAPADVLGRIKSVTLPEKMEGVVYIGRESCPRPIRLFEKEIEVFAGEEITFPGQPLGLLVGESPEILEKIQNEISIEVLKAEETDLKKLVYYRRIKRGNVKAEKGKAFQLIEGSFTVKGNTVAMLHPFGIAASYDRPSARLDIHIPTQWPGHVRESLAAALDMDKNNIVIHPLDFSVTGPALEWIPSILAVYTALAAVHGEKPAVLELSPRELGRWINTTGESAVHISTGLDKDGSVLFLDLSFTYDAGGLTPHVHRIIDREVYNAGGRYYFRHFQIRGEAWSSLWGAPKEPRVGYSLSPVLFALEVHLNRLAEISQQDPADLKKSLILKKNQKDIAGVPFDTHLSLESLIDQVCSTSDFSRKHGANELLKKRRVSLDREMDPLKGIGLSAGMSGNGLFGDREHSSRWKCRVTLNSDNTVAIETSGFLGGSGSARLCRSRVASILGLPADAVFLLKDPSPVDFDSGPSSHGRNASVILDLVESACGLIQKKRFRTPLPISVTKTTAPPRKNRWNDEHFEGNPFPRFSYGACVVEVELDPVDYLLKVRHVWMIIDSGPITDQKMAETTLRGGILATLLSCYGPRILKRMPGITVMFHKNSKIQLSSSLHELPSLLVPSALISSISQASGSFFDTLPLSTELIHKYTGTS